MGNDITHVIPRMDNFNLTCLRVGNSSSSSPLSPSSPSSFTIITVKCFRSSFGRASALCFHSGFNPMEEDCIVHLWDSLVHWHRVDIKLVSIELQADGQCIIIIKVSYNLTFIILILNLSLFLLTLLFLPIDFVIVIIYTISLSNLMCKSFK